MRTAYVIVNNKIRLLITGDTHLFFRMKIISDIQIMSTRNTLYKKICSSHLCGEKKLLFLKIE